MRELPSCKVVCWNALIPGYAQNGQGILANDVTYVCPLKACGTIGAIDKGKEFHNEIARQGLLEHDIVLGGALMYAKCGHLCQTRHKVSKRIMTLCARLH